MSSVIQAVPIMKNGKGIPYVPPVYPRYSLELYIGAELFDTFAPSEVASFTLRDLVSRALDGAELYNVALDAVAFKLVEMPSEVQS